MSQLKGFQKTYLRGLAHSLKPVVQIGQRGLAEGTVEEISQALERHELIKVKFNAVKDKELKLGLAAEIAQATACDLVGVIGHVSIFYRRQPDPEKRQIRVPLREARSGGA
ncbi:MAG: ribosome assembly RNA-binding protein YhbY [Pseudomonadota bacterium]